MTILEISVLIVALVNLTLAGFIFIHSRRDKPAIFYALISLFASLWSLATLFVSSRIYSVELFVAAAMLHYIAGGLAYLSFFWFAIYYPQKTIRSLTLPSVTTIVNLGVFILVLVPGLFFESLDLTRELSGRMTFYTPVYATFVAILGLTLIFTEIILIRKYLSAGGVDRSRLRTLIIGTSIAGPLGIILNLVLPWIGNFAFFLSGPLFVAAFTVTSIFVLIRYQLFSIKVIAAEAFVIIMVLILFIRLTPAKYSNEFGVNLVIFFLSIAFGYFLIRAVTQEVRDKEKIAKLAGELQESNKELKKLDQAKSEFISIASHQLRAPLTVIKGYVSMLLEDTYGKITEKGKKALKNVAISSEQLVKLIANMLDLSRIESGKIKYEFVKNNFEDIVAQVVQEFGPTAENRGIELVFEKSSMPLPEFAFDRDKIREVIVNFVDNALKYSPHGGRVLVREELAEKGSMKVLRFSVSDQGIGILPDEMEKLFTKFSRTKESQKIDPGGMGIGLYFVKRVVEDHLGEVGVESKGPGKGSTFWVELPIPPEMK